MKSKLKRFGRRLIADKKKFGVMLALLAIGLLLWGRLLLKEVPRTASADWETSFAEAYWGLAERQTVYVDLPQGMLRDVFVFDPNPYKRTRPEKVEPELPKTEVEAADEAARRKAVIEAVRELRLDSVVSADKPHAMINGLLIMPGQKIEGFTLLEISDRTVMLEKDGIRIRIRM